MLTITSASHLDHNATVGHLAFILKHFGDRTGFFAETVQFPRVDLPALPCSLRGPAVGLDPVPDNHVVMQTRPGRSYPSRVILPAYMPEWHWDLPTNRLTVIAGPHEGLPCMLYTAFGGPLAPKEPGDPSLSNDERAASEAFWAFHALVP